MAAINVFDQIEQDLASKYNIATYLRDPVTWDRVVARLRALTIVNAYTIQIEGRLDIISYQAYEDSRLDWILIVINKITRRKYFVFICDAIKPLFAIYGGTIATNDNVFIFWKVRSLSHVFAYLSF